MSQPIKIQINSLEALERLLGGDAALEIDVRASIAAAFAEKHLRSLAKTFAEAGLTGTVEHWLRDEVAQVVQVRSGQYSTKMESQLKPVYAAALKTEFDRLVSEKAAAMLKDGWAALESKLAARFDELAEHVKHTTAPAIAEDIIEQLAFKKINALLATKEGK
jgi:hypothetical protein